MLCLGRALLPEDSRCRSLTSKDACASHALRFGGAYVKPCTWLRSGSCTAGSARDCLPRDDRLHAANRSCSSQGLLLDLTLLRHPPWLCRRLARDDCPHFFLRARPAAAAQGTAAPVPSGAGPRERQHLARDGASRIGPTRSVAQR